ncbi:MAG: zinc ABC transporter substrate-binding protein [Sphaerochaetaceae bacterium]|nr:zinc ABC transporter substrate-binding protein [Sphaerochaetaceae bacterium]
MKTKTILLLAIVFSITMFLFGSGKTETVSTKPTIAVSILPEKTFVEKVAGDTVNVFAIIPPGASPENYEPSIQERMDLQNASIYFSIGVPTENINILRLISKDTKIVSLQDSVSLVYPDLTLDGGRDPHIWLSIKRVKVMIEQIYETLASQFPENKNLYRKNANLYLKELDETYAEIKEAVTKSKIKSFLVFHPAFQYFAEDFGLEMIAIEKDGKEATVKQLQDIIDLAKKEEIKVIFYQQEIDSRQTQAISNELNAKAISLEPLATNYTDNLRTMADKIMGIEENGN